MFLLDFHLSDFHLSDFRNSLVAAMNCYKKKQCLCCWWWWWWLCQVFLLSKVEGWAFFFAPKVASCRRLQLDCNSIVLIILLQLGLFVGRMSSSNPGHPEFSSSLPRSHRLAPRVWCRCQREANQIHPRINHPCATAAWVRLFMALVKEALVKEALVCSRGNM